MEFCNDPRAADGTWLPVMEEFYSLQGEGHHTGKAAYFIRIGGCDNACQWCDIKESWNVQDFPLRNTKEVVKRAIASKAGSAVVTGGEPLLANLDYLCSELKNAGFKLFLETSGSEPLSGKWDWICLSPKKNVPVQEKIIKKANELKVVVLDDSYFAFAEELADKVPETTLLYLQPEWSRRQQVMPLIIEYIKSNPKWVISLQSHKYMNIP